jgi:hypothetical protein
MHATVHCMILYMYSFLIIIRAFSSEGRTTWVRRYRNIARVVMRIVLPVDPGTYSYAHLILPAKRRAKRGFQCRKCDSQDLTSRVASLLMAVGKP